MAESVVKSIVSSEPLTDEEKEDFVAVIQFATSLMDTGLWHIGLDTDPEMPTLDGDMGVPIWAHDEDEARELLDFLLELAPRFPIVNREIRRAVALYHYVKLGLMEGQRLVTTVLMIVQNGINFRLSRGAYLQELERMKERDAR